MRYQTEKLSFFQSPPCLYFQDVGDPTREIDVDSAKTELQVDTFAVKHSFKVPETRNVPLLWSFTQRCVPLTGAQSVRRLLFGDLWNILIWAALESSDPRASNGGPNVEIWPNAADLAGFEMSRLTRNWVWNQQKSWQKNILFCQLGQFKRDEISSKKSNADVWPTVGCVRIRAFQRRSNYCCRTNLWGCGASFLKTRRNVRTLSKIAAQKAAGVRIVQHHKWKVTQWL